MNISVVKRLVTTSHDKQWLKSPIRNWRIAGRGAAAVTGLSALIVLWWGLSLLMPEYLLPGPGIVARAFVRLLREGHLVTDFLETACVSIVGLGLAALAAAVLAVGFVIFPSVEAVIYPVVIALRSIPAVAAAPLLIIWIGTGIFMKLFVSAFVAFFPILVYVLHGLRGPTQDYIDQFSIWAASRLQVLFYLRVPWALPSFFASLKVAVTYALVGSFVAELLGSQVGLGRMVFTAYYYFDTPTVMVGIFCFAFLGLILFGLTLGIEKLMLRKIPNVQRRYDES